MSRESERESEKAAKTNGGRIRVIVCSKANRALNLHRRKELSLLVLKPCSPKCFTHCKTSKSHKKTLKHCNSREIYSECVWHALVTKYSSLLRLHMEKACQLSHLIIFRLQIIFTF